MLGIYRASYSHEWGLGTKTLVILHTLLFSGSVENGLKRHAGRFWVKDLVCTDVYLCNVFEASTRVLRIYRTSMKTVNLSTYVLSFVHEATAI